MKREANCPQILMVIAAWLGATMLSGPGLAADTNQPQVTSGFASLYLSLCMQNLTHLDRLRAELAEKKLPMLPTERAAAFLDGREGNAWPVPYEGQLGNYVLVLLTHQSLCAIYARRVNTAEVEHDFDYLMSHVSAPMRSRLETDQVKISANGPVHTKGYVWSVIGHPEITRRMAFILSTSDSNSAPLQAVGTASVGSEN